MIAFATGAYTVTEERADFGIILHCLVHKTWTGTVKKHLTRDVERYQNLGGGRRAVFACYFLDEDPKIRKFMSLIGFEPWRTETAGDGRAVLLMRRP